MSADFSPKRIEYASKCRCFITASTGDSSTSWSTCSRAMTSSTSVVIALRFSSLAFSCRCASTAELNAQLWSTRRTSSPVFMARVATTRCRRRCCCRLLGSSSSSSSSPIHCTLATASSASEASEPPKTQSNTCVCRCGGTR